MMKTAEASAVKPAAVPPGSVQRMLLTREARSDRHSDSSAPPIVSEVLSTPGEPLDPVAREEMQSSFGHDFGNVRVHADDRAAESATAVDALAYTVGQNVVFGRGQYAPQTHEGRTILAHELTHTIQQGDAAPTSDLTVTDPDSEVEHEADAAAEAAVARTIEPGSASPAIARTGAPATKTVTINFTHLHGSTGATASTITYANTNVYNQANIEIVKGTDVTIDEPKSKAILGDDLILEEFATGANPTTEEKALAKENQTAGAIPLYFVKSLSQGSLGENFRPGHGSGLLGVVASSPDTEFTFCHELGHVLLDDGGHTVPDATYLMYPTAQGGLKLTPDQITKIRASTFAK